ncbi:transposable element Tcb2 transposase [Trichonephila clavipes]|nr:transposable element Tcb2 transposase [Trichonephila clavipes]
MSVGVVRPKGYNPRGRSIYCYCGQAESQSDLHTWDIYDYSVYCLFSSIRLIKRGTIKVVPGNGNRTVSHWGNVMFTDESRFALEPDDKRIRIWRKQGTRNQPQNITKHHAFRGGSTMVWAGISLGYNTNLYIFKRSSVTAVRYRDDVLEPIMKLYAAAVGPTFVLMDDNARPHRADIVDDYLVSEGIAHMAWPAYSPDLNLIENLWDTLGRAVSSRFPPPVTLIELETALQEKWRLLNSAVVYHLIESMDEVEKLAYQLNEEAERTERPIRRLSRIIGKLEEGRSVTSAAAEFGIAHSIVSRLWRQFQTTGTAIRGFSSGRPRGTTPAYDRYIVLQARRNRWPTEGEITRHKTQATGRPILHFAVARRLQVVVCLHDALYDESRFSLSSDSHRIIIWRERGCRNHPSNIIERDRYGGHGVLVWGDIMLGSRTDLHIFDAGSVNGTRYCNEILLPYVRLFRGAMCLQFLFMDDNAPRTVAAEQLLESQDIERMDWPARSPDLKPIEHVWDFLGRRLAARTLPPVTIRELRLTLQDEWAAMPQQLIDTLILSMGRRCETCLAVRGDHIPY